MVCFTSDHDAAFSSLTPARVRTVIDAWVDRTEELSRNPQIEQVFCFENRGEEIGVTLSHPHGQIYGYPYVTPRTKQMLASARAHADATGRNLFADVVTAETQSGERVVVQSVALDRLRSVRGTVAARSPSLPEPPGTRSPVAHR